MFNIAGDKILGQSGGVFTDATAANAAQAKWRATLISEGKIKKVTETTRGPLSAPDIERIVNLVFTEVAEKALVEGVVLGEGEKLLLMGELSGLGPLLSIISMQGIEDIAINLGHIYTYVTGEGWKYYGPTPDGLSSGIRAMIDNAGKPVPTPANPISDAILMVMIPTANGYESKRLRINFIMPPASLAGDIITIRVSSYSRVATDGLGLLCSSHLPAVTRPKFTPRNFPRGDGVLSPEAANYLLSVMVNGGTVIISGTTGSGKTFLARHLLQGMLDFYPPGAIRLFIIEDVNEVVLNQWDGDTTSDTKNIVYTITRPQIGRDGPPPIEMYDLVKAALRSRPHGLVIGEARGAEAWELIRAAATGHGHSAFTIHAVTAEHVWFRFIQVVRSNPDVAGLTPAEIARYFADAVTAIVHVQRSSEHGQRVTEIVEVNQVVESVAGRPTFTPLFIFNSEKNALVASGNQPGRKGFRAVDLGLPIDYFRRA
jgi:type IV secretory pathway ATPase VirB11/archaellum biosynthesis ATPase